MTDTTTDLGDIRFLKHRDAGGVLNATFAFLRRNAREAVVGFLAIVAPVALASGIAATLWFRQMGDAFTIAFGDPEAVDPQAFEDAFSAMFGASYFGMLVFASLAGAVAQAAAGAYVRLYRDGEAGAVTVGVLWEAARGLILPMLGLNLLFGLVAMFSGVVSIVPCLGTLAWLAFIVWITPYYIVTMASRGVEASSLAEAARRARALVKGSWGFAFGAFFLAFVVFYVLIGALSVPLAVVGFALTTNSATGDVGGMMTAFGAMMAPLQVLSMVGYLIPLVAAYFIHGRLVEEMDGTALHDDLDALADRSAASRWEGLPPASGRDASTPPAEPGPEAAPPPASGPEAPPSDDAPPSGFRGGGFGGGA